MRIKKPPKDDFGPRGKDMAVLGRTDEVTHGIIVGRCNGDDWGLEVSSSFTMHGAITDTTRAPYASEGAEVPDAIGDVVVYVDDFAVFGDGPVIDAAKATLANPTTAKRLFYDLTAERYRSSTISKTNGR